MAAPSKAGPQDNGSVPGSAGERAGDVAKHLLARTKGSSEGLQELDITPGAILRGEDKRTTVVVRHLHGPRARRGLLMLLDRCGLGDQYSFFHMPWKEDRSRSAGIAFVNFASPHDVHIFCGAVASGLWRDVCGKPPPWPPAVSYARFQGHEALARHFGPSAALPEQDPEKRPIARPEVLGRSASGDAPVETTRALRTPGPPGIADGAARSDHHDLAAERGPPGKSQPALHGGHGAGESPLSEARRAREG